MAKGFVGFLIKEAKAAERDRVRRANASIREQNAALKEEARQIKAREAAIKRATVANERDRKAWEKEVKAAHVKSQEAEVDLMNAQVNDTFDELDGLLEATIEVDDYIDLNTLLKPEATTPFDRPELEDAAPAPLPPRLPSEPKYKEPPQPKGFFGKKKKLAAAIQGETEAHTAAHKKWEKIVANLQDGHKADLEKHAEDEALRMETLAAEKARFLSEIKTNNAAVASFITNLSYGDADAIQEYIALVVENSKYPDHFPVRHDFSFDPSTAELSMQVSIPSPNEFPAVKIYKYVKTSDEIRATDLSVAEKKKRYCSAIYQVAIRSLHEVFEADRRDLIQTISLEVGTFEKMPATGKIEFLPFVGVSVGKGSFMDFDLSGLVPLATLKHLGAAISKDPLNLMTVDVKGIRKS
jgi:restriction system protein